MLKSIKQYLILGFFLACIHSPGAGFASTISNEELITVGEEEAIIYFDTETTMEVSVEYGACPGVYDKVSAEDLAGGRHHLVRLSDLRPGINYYYRTRAGDLVGEDGTYSPGKFETLRAPTGKYLFSFATITDLHFGYHVSGIIGGPGGAINEGVAWLDDDNPFWRFTNEAAVAEINSREEIDFTVIKGDLTIDYRAEEFAWAKQTLDKLEKPYYVMRGNHDRVGDNLSDYFLDTFDLENSYYYFDHSGYRFIMLDSSDLENGWGKIDDDQLAWLGQTLDQASGMPVMMFVHHAAAPAAGGVFTFWEPTPAEFVEMIAEYPEVAGVFSGHSHRNFIALDPATGDLPFSETAATKDYPGVWTLYRVYEDGYMAITYRINCADCLVWYEMTRAMYNGNAQDIMMGDLAARNYVYNFEPAPGYNSDGCAIAGKKKKEDDSGCATAAGSTGGVWGAIFIASIICACISLRLRRINNLKDHRRF